MRGKFVLKKTMDYLLEFVLMGNYCQTSSESGARRSEGGVAWRGKLSEESESLMGRGNQIEG